MHTTRPNSDVANEIKLDLPPPQPVDLTKFKTIKFKVKTISGVRYIVMTPDDYELLSELFVVLAVKIDNDTLYIQEYRNFYEPSDD